MSYFPRIFVVGGDRAMVDWCASHLNRDGCMVQGFRDPESFWASAWQQQADCVLADLDGGIGAANLLNQSQRAHGVLPVIFLGTAVRMRRVCQLFQHGAFDFHEKPLAAADLRRSIADALARKAQGGFGDEDAPVEPWIRARIETLTPREFEVLGEMLRGMSIKQLAARFGVSIQTAAKHRARVLSKIKCENEVHALHLLGRRWHQIFHDIVV